MRRYGGRLPISKRDCGDLSVGMSIGTRPETVNGGVGAYLRSGGKGGAISLLRRRRALILQTAIQMPRKKPASAIPPNIAPIAITSHSHQGIDQLEVTCWSKTQKT